MTEHPRTPHDAHDQIDLYLDGMLTPAEEQAFERRAAADPDLARELSVQRSIDSRLAARLMPPARSQAAAVPSLNGALLHARAAHRSSPSIRRHIALAAAIALMLTAVAATAWIALAPQPSRPHPLVRVTPERLYENIVDDGFTPGWVCRDDAEFMQATRDYLGVPMMVEPDPEITIVGWLYESPGVALARSTRVLLARVRGEPVVVLLDRASADRVMGSQSGDLHLHRRELGGVVMYELSPFDAPGVITRFREQPAS